MTDGLILGVVSSFTTMLTVIITAIINTRGNRKLNEKVDTYHKEVNGKMGILLETTKALGNAEGKAEEKAGNP